VTERRFGEWLPLGGEGGLPYSKGLMAKSLIATGVSVERAYLLARRLELDLADRNERAVDPDRLQELAIEVLGEDEGTAAVRRLMRFQELQQLDRPIIVLVGGATGTGKSSVATEVAHRLGITRVTSTDFVRQTMRAFFSQEFMPSIHYSSFDAAAAVTDEDGDADLRGFLDQTRNVLVGVKASIDRALEEGWSMVLEGVHLVPGMLPAIDGALVVPCVLTISSAEVHSTHFWIRDAHSEGVRPVEKYLTQLDKIRKIQDYIVERAQRTRVSVVENANIEQAVASVLELVLSSAERMESRR
jgi:2-phosphoglycerate kinase